MQAWPTKKWPQPHLKELTAAMESAGFTKCHEDTPRSGDASGNYAHWSWDFVVGEPCPAYDSSGFARGPLDAKLSILPYSACGTMKRAIANYYGNAHYI